MSLKTSKKISDKESESGGTQVDENERPDVVEECDWSFPIRLVANEAGCRMTTSLGVWKKKSLSHEAFCITGVEKSGVVYFTIQVDKSPVCYIDNQCNIPLHVGQTLMNLSLSG